MRLRYLHCPHRRRKVRPRDIRFQILYRLFFRSASKSSMDCPSTPAAPFFALTRLYASQTSPLEISNGLTFGSDLSTRSPPGQRPVALANKPQMSRPLRSPPITGASALLRAGPPACPHRYSTPHSFCCSTRSLSPPATFPGHWSPYRYTPSHVPCSSRRSGSRRLHTGHHLASKRVSARFIPRIYIDPGSDVVSCLSMLRRRFALARLPDPCLTAFTPPFPHRSPQRSSAYAA